MYHQPGLLIKAYNILNLDSQVSQGDMPPQQTLELLLTELLVRSGTSCILGH